MTGHPTELRQCVSHGGIPNAQDLHTPMMIPSGLPKEVLDLPAHPYDTSPRAPE